MAKPSAIDQLNAEDKAWLDARFRDQGFCGGSGRPICIQVRVLVERISRMIFSL